MNEQKPLQDNRPNFVPDCLSFVSLGGSGEFGCNLNVYHCDGKLLIVDCGLGFPDDRFPGVDILLPDPSFLREMQEDIVGIILTHAHDDHKAAIAPLWPQLLCPVYATPFVADTLRHQLEQWNLLKRMTLKEIALGQSFDLGPFKIEMINTAHSVIESSMLMIKTPYGQVLHTGDWRFDDHPMEGTVTDVKKLATLAQEPVLAIIGDSTNATVKGRHPSEQELIQPLADIFSKATGRIVITTFSHSVPRMRSVVEAARKVGRIVGMTGRSMLRVQDIARKHGYLADINPFLSEREIKDCPPNKVVLLATGSQGETGSAIDRLATDTHQTLSLQKGDIVIFSAREIPGNEKTIERVRNAFLRRGIRTIFPENEFVHASGHAYADEIKQLINIVKPITVIPVHGDEDAQYAHVDLANEMGVKNIIIPRNGDIIAIRMTGPEKTGQVIAGLMAVDGTRVVPMRDSLLLKDRHRLANEGSIVATVIIDEDGYLLNDPILVIAGLGADEAEQYELEEMVFADVEQTVLKADNADRRDPEKMQETIRLAIRRRIKNELGKRPMLVVNVVQVQ
jgi:ribonuclease J